jgi:hypothetical protein
MSVDFLVSVEHKPDKVLGACNATPCSTYHLITRLMINCSPGLSQGEHQGGACLSSFLLVVTNENSGATLQLCPLQKKLKMDFRLGCRE